MRLIDAEALMEEWLKKPDPEHLTEREVKIIAQCAEDIVDAIYDAPIIDAEPVRHGKWIEYPDCLAYEKALYPEDFVCSECASVWNAIDNEGDRFDYCPNCGAKMDGGNEE